MIGSQMAHVLSRSGMRVIGISRKGESLPGFEAVYSGYLGNPLDLSFKEEKIDVFLQVVISMNKKMVHIIRKFVVLETKSNSVWFTNFIR